MFLVGDLYSLVNYFIFIEPFSNINLNIFLIANEWNELQTFRKINPTMQLIFLLFALKVINLEALTRADCNQNLFPDSNIYQAPYSGILRVAMAASMYIVIG